MRADIKQVKLLKMILGKRRYSQLSERGAYLAMESEAGHLQGLCRLHLSLLILPWGSLRPLHLSSHLPDCWSQSPP